MNYKTLLPDPAISAFVKSILVFENENPAAKTTLPFFADGYPGIMFQVTENGLYVMPHNKLMPDFFLYGQTIHPIELQIEGGYHMIVFQLYPFVLKSFFEVNPQVLNDDCYDLLRVDFFDVKGTISQLKSAVDFDAWNSIIASFLHNIFEIKKEQIDIVIQNAIAEIIENAGQQTIKSLTQKLNISERTFERRFTAEVGVTPKQFSKMIQFQNSLKDLTDKDYVKLTDVVYKNGFADQSHFIRVFKDFTGKTPKSFNKKSG